MKILHSMRNPIDLYQYYTNKVLILIKYTPIYKEY